MGTLDKSYLFNFARVTFQTHFSAPIDHPHFSTKEEYEGQSTRTEHQADEEYLQIPKKNLPFLTIPMNIEVTVTLLNLSTNTYHQFNHVRGNLFQFTSARRQCVRITQVIHLSDGVVRTSIVGIR